MFFIFQLYSKYLKKIKNLYSEYVILYLNFKYFFLKIKVMNKYNLQLVINFLASGRQKHIV